MKRSLLFGLCVMTLLAVISAGCTPDLTSQPDVSQEAVDQVSLTEPDPALIETPVPSLEAEESVEITLEEPGVSAEPGEVEIEPADDQELAVGEEADQEPQLLTVGPEDFPEGINPLTGLPVDDPALLRLPPALVSVSNFPASGRPQAGLNTSPIVFEMTVGQGMTRFLVLFYGQYPQLVSGQTEGTPSVGTSTGDEPGSSASIGPIRSGRLPYEILRKSYSGFLVMASAHSSVGQTLSQASSVYGSDEDDINSAAVSVDRLQQMAQSQAQSYVGSNFSLEGMMFSQTPPEGGLKADTAWVFYSKLNQIQWQYDQNLGTYIRYDIHTDGSDTFSMATDRLTGEPLAKENVIVIFADHDYRAPTLIDIELNNKPSMRAILFRDGQMHEIFWTTRYGEFEQQTGLLRPIRFVDADGNPVPLKHGHTWIHFVSTASYHLESALSENPFHPMVEEQGSGIWLVRYRGLY